MNFKKFNAIASGIFIAVSAAAVATIISCTKGPSGKEFTGIGDGRNGKIEVSITVKDGKIVAGKIVSDEETEFAKPAAATVMAQAVKNGNADALDTVSGATLTSEGTIQAIQAALAAASGTAATAQKAKDTSCDIVIVGAGGAGMTAAYEAKTNGANVILVEKM